jgi:hypothetical protein
MAITASNASIRNSVTLNPVLFFLGTGAVSTVFFPALRVETFERFDV